jgi:hypothetical protein
MEDGEVQVTILIVEPTHVSGPGMLESTWSRETGSERFVPDDETPSLLTSIVADACSADIAGLASALGPERAGNNTFFNLALSPTGHVSLALYLDDILVDVTTRNVERVPDLIDALRALARNARAAAGRRIGELFPWNVDATSFAVPTDTIAYLGRARGVLDRIPGMQSTPSDDPGWVSWSWSDREGTGAVGAVDVHATDGTVSVSLELGDSEQRGDGVYLEWTRDPASASWKRDDTFEDEAAVQEFVERSEHRVELTLARLEAHDVYEFSLGTNDAGRTIAVSTVVDVGDRSIDHAAPVFDIMRTDFLASST